MLLTELADRKVNFQIIRADKTVFDAEARVGKRKIVFSAVYINTFWNVVFSELYYDEGEWIESYDLTGSGHEFGVLSLVTTCMKEFLQRNKPDEIRFSAEKDDKRSRATIYRRIADRILKGYKREEDDEGPSVEFRYVKESLNELFDTDVKYKVTRETSGQFKTEAMINDRKIVFRAELDRGPKGEYWDVSFEEQNGFHATYAATGKGKAFEVMSMVKASLAEFKERYQPEIVYFTAETANGLARANVYRKMVGQVLKGYELEETKVADEHVFIYRRM